MRRFLIELILIAIAFAILWIFAGRQMSGLVDRFTTAKIESKPVKIIAYQDSGDGGTLIIDEQRLSLAPLNPHVGSTKDNQLGLASAGKVFSLGPLHPNSPEETLVALAPNPDSNLLTTRRSYVPWPTFDGSAKPHLNRRSYYEFTSKDSGGAKLDMVWSADGAEDATTLIRVEITNPAR